MSCPLQEEIGPIRCLDAKMQTTSTIAGQEEAPVPKEKAPSQKGRGKCVKTPSLFVIESKGQGKSISLYKRRKQSEITLPETAGKKRKLLLQSLTELKKANLIPPKITFELTIFFNIWLEFQLT